MAEKTPNRVAITVADDWMTAWGEIDGDVTDPKLTPAEVRDALEKAEVAVTQDVRNRVKEFVKRVHERGKLPGPFALAQGLSADDVVHEEFHWDARYQGVIDEWREETPMDFYSYNSIVTVEPDSVIGTITTDRPAELVNIRGDKLPGSPTIVPIAIDEKTLRRQPGLPADVTALTAGRLIDAERMLRLETVLHVDDVSFETGNIESNVSVEVTGLVPDKFRVASKRSISVGLSVESADLVAGQNIMIRRGIVGRNAGLVKAMGNITVKYTTDAHLVLQKGNLKVARQLMNTYACIGGALDARQASVIGGCIFARNGAAVNSVGSSAGIPTRLTVGVQPDALREIAEIGRGVKNGSLQLAKVRQRRKDLYEMAHVECNPKIFVTGSIFPNTTLRIVDRVVEITKTVRGPVSIEKRKIDGVTQIVAVNKLTGSVTTLKSRRHDPQDLLDGFMLEGDDETAKAA